MYNSRMKKFVILTLVLLCSGCNEMPVSQVTRSGCPISSYGEGVYYFSCARDFGSALAEFKKQHPHIVSVTGYTDIIQHATAGYWVVLQGAE